MSDSPLRIPITIGVVGHRDIPEVDQDRVCQQIREIVESYLDRFTHSDVLLLTALAEGADQLAVRACAGLHRVRVAAVLPMAPGDYAQDFTSPVALEFFHQCRASVWSEMIVSDHRGGPDEAIISDRADAERIRAIRYQQCARFISANSHVLIAVWDGREPDLIGGTADTVYFRVPGLVALPPAADSVITGAQRVGVTLHIPAGRDSHAHPPLTMGGETASGDVMKLVGSRAWSPWHGGVVDPTADAIDSINHTMAKAPCTDPPDASQVTSSLMAVCDSTAGINQRRFRRLAAAVLALGVVGLVLVGLQQKVSSLWVMASVTLTLVTIGVMWWALGRLDVKRRFQQQRVLAEGARVQEVWLAAGVKASPADSYLQHQPEVAWIRTVLRSAWLVDVLHAARRADSERSLEDAEQAAGSWMQGQLTYFEGTASRRGALQRSLSKSRIYSSIAMGGLVLAVATLGPEVWRAVSGADESVGILFSQSLWEVGLAVAAATTAYAELMAFREVSRRYAQSTELFRSGLARLEASGRDPDQSQRLTDIRDVVTEVGKEALQETSAWFATSYERNVRPI